MKVFEHRLMSLDALFALVTAENILNTGLMQTSLIPHTLFIQTSLIPNSIFLRVAGVYYRSVCCQLRWDLVHQVLLPDSYPITSYSFGIRWDLVISDPSTLLHSIPNCQHPPLNWLSKRRLSLPKEKIIQKRCRQAGSHESCVFFLPS